MATMTMTARGTPSLNPPLIQNTAPVHEHQCMFSRDVQKKAKKWHDGTLKFHTFNSRVMVYDQDRHFIGDLHYRGEEDFAEGLELRLDRGVLVDVGYRLGETQTDLEQVLNSKSRDDDATKHSSPTAPKPLRVTAAASQQKPRSLKEVLSASEAQHGRARTTYQSPYEQRQALANIQPVEPPLKKQKVVPAGKENLAAANLQQPESKTVQRASSRQAEQPPSRPSKDAVLEFQEVMDLSSDEDVRRPTKLPLFSTKGRSPLRKERSRNKTQLLSAVPAKAKEAASSRLTARPPADDSPHRGLSRTGLRHSNNPPNISIAMSKSTSQGIRSQLLASSGSGQVSLSLPTPKARPKLMYRALLPSSILAPILPEITGKTSPIVATMEETHSPAPASRRASKQHSSRQALDELDDDSFTIPLGEDVADCRQSEDMLSQHQEQPRSPLFIPNAEKATPLPSSQHLSQDDLESRMFADVEHSHSSNGEHGAALEVERTVDALSSEKANTPAPCSITDKLINPGPEQVQCESPKASVELMPPPPAILPSLRSMTIPGSLRERPFRRVVSESNASYTQEVADEDLLGLTTPVMARKPKSVIGASPSNLRRTSSDSAAIGNSDDVPLNAMVPNPEVVECGPWTSLEAFLLFESWPTGKNKPDFGQASTPDLGDSRCGPDFQGIISARDMLRDDMNVL